MACERTLVLVDLHLDEEIQAGNDQVAGNVESAAHVEDIGVFEGNLLGELHRPEDDDEVLTTESHTISFMHHFTPPLRLASSHDTRQATEMYIHLGAEAEHFGGWFAGQGKPGWRGMEQWKW